jgi:hypothetical protein
MNLWKVIGDSILISSTASKDLSITTKQIFHQSFSAEKISIGTFL